MRYKKGSLVILITVFAIIINILGKVVAAALNLPVWLDSFGTILISYVYGPVCGAIVGLANNIIYGIFVEEQSIYCFVGMILGIVAGLVAKKGKLETRFGAVTLGAELALMCAILSVPIDTIFYDGVVGNIWGDQILLMCVKAQMPKILACFIAQFYIEFLDKLVSVYGVYLIIKFVRARHKNKSPKLSNGKIASMIILVLVFSMLGSQVVYAIDDDNNINNMTIDADEDYDSYTHTIYSSSEGLLAGEANDIEQTNEGQLWIGTYAGLYSYDGISFKLINDIDSIKNVRDLYVDEEGRLWVGTNDSGVTMMINGHVMNVLNVDNGLLSNSVRSIICDSYGNYYIGTPSGVSIVTLSGGVKVLESFPDVKDTISLSADDNGKVYAITDKGDVYCFQDGKLTNVKLAAFGEHTAHAAFFAKNGKLYIGTQDNTVIVYSDGSASKKEREYKCEGLESVNSFTENEKGEIFICSDSGVGYFNRAGEYKLIHTEKFSSSIDHMLEDYQGNIWFSSSRLGLIKLCKTSFINLFPEVDEEAHVVNAVINTNGQILCGTDDGLVIIDEATRQSVSNELTELFANVRIRHIGLDSKHNIWVSTTGSGLYRIKLSGEGYDVFNFDDTNGMPGKRVRCTIELSNGDIVSVGDDGVAFIKDDNVISTITDKLVNRKSLCVLEHKGKIYVGSDGGGISIINNRVVEKNISRVDGLSSDVILRMVYDKDSDGIFVVTSNGICFINASDEVQYLDKFPYSNNYDIIPGNNGDMWVLSSAGIYVASSGQLVDNINKDYELLNVKSGLRASLTANSYSKVVDGILYLCCDNDVVMVDLYDYNSSARSYRMSLSSVNVDGEYYEISRTEPLHISADASSITFAPFILNYSLNDPYVGYYLEGFDTTLNIMPLSQLKDITYTNLEPGQYTFRIVVFDSSREHTIESAGYVIVKEMDMYQRWWFKLYFVVISALIVIWGTWFITKKRTEKTIAAQKLELEYVKKQVEMGNETILSIARTVDAKDSNTSEHSFRVSQYSVAIARSYGFDEDRCENIRQMALLHDIGKIGIPDAILNKPGKLTAEEYEIMKSHVTRGGEILKDFTLIERVDVGARYHHERYDGKGYCSGLKGEEIPIEARIIGIADAFDAMTANRVYRKQLDIEVVISELKKGRGSQFDPNLTDIMLSLIDEKVIDIESLYDKSKEEK